MLKNIRGTCCVSLLRTMLKHNSNLPKDKLVELASNVEEKIFQSEASKTTNITDLENNYKLKMRQKIYNISNTDFYDWFTTIVEPPLLSKNGDRPLHSTSTAMSTKNGRQEDNKHRSTTSNTPSKSSAPSTTFTQFSDSSGPSQKFDRGKSSLFKQKNEKVMVGGVIIGGKQVEMVPQQPQNKRQKIESRNTGQPTSQSTGQSNPIGTKQTQPTQAGASVNNVVPALSSLSTTAQDSEFSFFTDLDFSSFELNFDDLELFKSQDSPTSPTSPTSHQPTSQQTFQSNSQPTSRSIFEPNYQQPQQPQPQQPSRPVTIMDIYSEYGMTDQLENLWKTRDLYPDFLCCSEHSKDPIVMHKHSTPSDYEKYEKCEKCLGSLQMWSVMCSLDAADPELILFGPPNSVPLFFMNDPNKN